MEKLPARKRHTRARSAGGSGPGLDGVPQQRSLKKSLPLGVIYEEDLEGNDEDAGAQDFGLGWGRVVSFDHRTPLL